MAGGSPPSRRRAAKQELFLVVTDGPDRGAFVAVDAHPRIVGRAKEADLSLTDLRVSRRHFEIALGSGGARVRALSPSSRMLVRSESASEAVVRPGDAIVVGKSALSLMTEAPKLEVESTSVSTVLSELASDVRGLGAIFSLTEALDAAVDEAGLETAVSTWAGSIGARSTHVLSEAAASEHPDAARIFPPGDRIASVAAGDGEGMTFGVPVPSDPPTHLAITLRSGAGAEAHRLLAVAARVIASGIARVRRLTALSSDTADLRQLAVGSARGFLGDSAAAKEVSRLLPKLAASSAAVLLLGESGTGKTFVARLLHESGPRRDHPLRVINCAAIPEALVEGELFGHERGAFTGAVAPREGALEAAGRGTLLLDEIGELPATSQAKLLRVLEDKRFERLGSNRSIALEARVIAATNRDLKEMVDAGRFRADLFFRISVVNVRVPPLRDRGQDLPLLANHILRDLAPSTGRRVTGFSAAAMRALAAYPWPGNVRELRNAIEHALVLGDDELIEPSDFPEPLRARLPALADGMDPDVVRLPASLAALEARAIESALRASGGNRQQAAALLGINRVTLYKKLKEPASE